jgi:hypothetical protein
LLWIANEVSVGKGVRKRRKREGGARCSPLTNSLFESESRKEHSRHKLAAMNEEVKKAGTKALIRKFRRIWGALPLA